MIQQMLAIWSLVPLPFLKPANNIIAEFIKEHNDVIDPNHKDEAHIALANILYQTVVEGHCTMSDVNNINVIKQGLGCALGAMMIACNR